MLTFSPFAIAQEPDLAVVLTANVRCSASAREDIGRNLQKLTAPPEAIGTALNLVSADQTKCAPVREAAAALSAAYAPPSGPSPDDLAQAQTQAILAETLAEADRRAGQLKFEVGPPPRNMTSGRAERP